MTKSVVIDGVEYVPKAKAAVDLAIVNACIEFDTPDIIAPGTQLGYRYMPPKYEITIENYRGEQVSVEISKSAFLMIEELVR